MWANGSIEAAIIKSTGMRAAEARRLAQRCLALNKTTKSVHGFWECLPNRRLEGVKHHRRKAFDTELAKEGKGMDGVKQHGR